ncbi:MAG: RagB/SusD family nutrient uptake outer membrane protein, partial [Rhodothermales bacterium]|nr:RagB/SusD family nutrient uptake outer membrane protein [Rhodothermales bacterium]
MPRLRPRLALGLLLGLLPLTACELDIADPNAATEEEALNDPAGIRALAVDLQGFYATSALQPTVLTPAITTREAAANTTLANLLDLEAGGTALPASNADVLRLWYRNYKTVSIAEALIENAPRVPLEAGTESGILALAHLFKAIGLGNVAQNFEQGPPRTDEDEAVAFVSRQELFEEAIRLLEEADALLDATPPSDRFASDVLAPGLDLESTIGAYLARYRLFAGDYDGALDAAAAVDRGVTSVFGFDGVSGNPLYQQFYQLEYYAARDLLGLENLDPDDQRLLFYETPADSLSEANGYPVNIAEGFVNAFSQPFPAYLPDEMTLIEAEANVRLGNLDDAVGLIDAVRTQAPEDDPFGVGAGLGPYDGPVTESALLDEIFLQRGAELFLQGLRLEDARRLSQPGPDPSDPFA